MCGIIGVVGKADVVPSLIEGLKRLEYRGYDSAGIATLVNDSIERRRSEGKIARLEEKVAGNGIHGDIGIGHTRWATHGVPNERNAHPHATDRVALVHNGIIENYRELAAELSALGHVFASETDSEIAAHLITRYLNEGMTPQQAVATAIRRMDGAYALAILFKGEHDLIVGARKGSPLAVGWGEGEMYLGSDALALSPFARRISYLEEGDWVEISRAGAIFHDEQDRVAERPAKPTALSGAMIGKGNYPHFMLKEIYEQPGVIGDTLRSMWNPASGTIDLPPLDIDLAAISRITLVACGTSYLGAMVAKYWFEKVARIAADIDIASEFRYRDTPLEAGGLAIFISQSGETIDTLAALRHAKEAGQKTIAIVNVPESTMAREADAVLPTLAGPEIGVASTKAFTCQLVLLACLVIATARARGAISGAEEARLSNAIAEVPSRAAEVLNGDEAIQALAAEVAEARDVLYIGRNTGYPIALEGALKLKEISYIHAEGYAAGELKHGPIALIDDTVPVIVVAPSDALFEKTFSNMQEVMARGGKVIFMSDAKGCAHIGKEAFATIELPHVHPFVAPILYAIPVQLLAYHVAVLKGTDVDQPRNLAKSVTVE
ncbi:glutamine--fructose-6-phosphate transaminase (isomerizing) [Oceanibaculum indicum]|uniref:Glutamine--fructose-6-phosphate aminotransferase [isomerizing] n=1 Tax=Oceanibaculum indicum TaxID=526216 RepID=A0A420WA82_9PROT|nr:glutamine--fructose-6-phosphate transaminase (isomerizing) [Oceanibaculum indicum]RKQ67866.1 glucosamine--fructose-6-phosphate aminotransferase (isomerizing) [Oceanibaculum indicum]